MKTLRYGWIIFVIIVLTIVLTGCVSKPKVVTEYVSSPVTLSHPQMPEAPDSPSGSGPMVVTVDNMAKKIEPQKAYIAFTYPDWLEFAKWLHKQKRYEKDLIQVIDDYRNQDETLKK